MYFRVFGIIWMIFGLATCKTGITSDFKGGITKDTLIGQTWQQKNSDFTGTFQRWFFLNSEQIIFSIRGASIYYTWTPYTISGTVQPNPENQTVFELTGGSPGGTLTQYLLIWFINAEGSTAVFQVYTTPEDITRYLVNSQNVVSSYNYKKVNTQ